ncbi:MAG: hypothetical protein PHC85_00625 [Candidatus Pacebacteria bacterium]|nr:hypothetical protein [Candidatus Paceibacterota bacterium]
MHPKILKICSLVFAVCVSSFLVFETIKKPEGIKSNTARYDALAAVPLSGEIKFPDFNNLEIEAKSACVFDVRQNKFLFELDSDKQLPLASVAKLMTALVAKENILPETLVEISKEAMMQEGDSGFSIGEMWRLPDIMSVMLLSSSNDAAFALASAKRNTVEPSDVLFVKKMNEKAAALNLRNTYFFNSTGLDLSKGFSGAYGTCRDITFLADYLLNQYPELLEITTKEKAVINNREFQNTNKLFYELPLLLGSKTGYSDLAGGNLVIITDTGINNPVIIIVLGSSFDGRFEDAKKIYERL